MDQQALDRDDARLPAEIQFTLIVLAILLVIAFAGFPGGVERTAGDGSWKLRHGWAARQARSAATSESPAPAATATDSAGG